MSPSKKPRPPHRSHKSHATGRHGADRRPHVAALVALGALGWRLTEMRPDVDGDAPPLWRVTIRRHDEGVSITVTEADPDVALDELTRYAAADPEEP